LPAWTAEHQEHLSTVDQAVEVTENLNFLLPLRDPFLGNERRPPEHVHHILLVVSVTSIPVDAQISPRNAEGLARVLIRVLGEGMKES
jgi:hypothetical protein